MAISKDPQEKTVFVAEYTGDLLHIPKDYKHYIKASSIGSAHRKGRELFEKGISFKTREPIQYEQAFIDSNCVPITETD